MSTTSETAFALETTDAKILRPDLAERREAKFLFPDADLNGLRREILKSCRPIVYAEPVSEVYSLYFDTPRLDSCRANLEGDGIRHKSRLRWYDSNNIGTKLYFETKWRKNESVGKKRTELITRGNTEDLGHRTLYRQLCESLPSEQLVHLPRDTDVVALVRYKREHFAHENGASRLTLDYEMSCYPQLGHGRLNTKFTQKFHGIALVEYKTSIDKPPRPPGLLNRICNRPVSFSKYVTACQRLGYAASF